MSSRLETYLNGALVGHFTDEGGGLINFCYDPGWRAAAIAGRAHQISVSLPMSAEGPLDATAYVAGLLPDSVRHRDLLADQLGISEDPSDFAFLSKLGRDSAGALVILPEGEGLARGAAPAVDWLDEARLADHLRGLPRRPLLIDDEEGIVLSLAGVNDKAAVVVKGGRIGLPRHGLPSTHIIKVDIPGLEDSIITEHFCLSLARAVGLRTPRSEIHQAEDQTFMLMSRYDRSVVDGRVLRVHQEDFCQALGVMPGRKYQRHGGPGWADGFRLMAVTRNAAASRNTLLRMAAFQFLTGNPDAHAKNYSLLYRGGDGVLELAPIYDLNNAAAFRRYFKTAKPIMAMRVGAKDNRDEVGPEDWDAFARECGLSPEVVLQTVTATARSILTEIGAVQAACLDREAVRVAAEGIRTRCAAWAGGEPDPNDAPNP
jgi:serine/threonine-protein kinase HipA